MVNLGSAPMSPSQDIDPRLDEAPCGFFSVRDDGTLDYVNATLLAILGWDRASLTGQSIERILPVASRIFYQTHVFPLLRLHSSIDEVYLSLRSRSGPDIPILLNGVRRQHQGKTVNDCIVIVIGQRIQYEEEILKAKKRAEAAMAAQKQAEATLQQQYQRAVALAQITQQIRQSLELPEVFAVAAREVRQCLGVDRAGIFRFADSGGGFVSEAVAPGVESVMALALPHQGLGDHYQGIRPNGGPLAVRDIHGVSLLPEHQRLLAQLQVQATLVVPLRAGGKIWGLVCLHQCSGPRYWQEVEIELVENIAVQLAIAIQQADLFHQLQQELHERQRTETQLNAMNAELRRAQGRLEQMALTDALTQIANRRHFNDRLTQTWTHGNREGQPLALLLFDIDYFKPFNDTYGHQRGDDCLLAIAQAVQAVVCRPTDLLARYGGEEFAVILPNTDRSGAAVVAQRIHQAVAALAISHETSTVSDRVTISLGLSVLTPGQGLPANLLLKQADQALYQAKRQGRDRTVAFEAEPGQTSPRSQSG